MVWEAANGVLAPGILFFYERIAGLRDCADETAKTCLEGELIEESISDSISQLNDRNMYHITIGPL